MGRPRPLSSLSKLGRLGQKGANKSRPSDNETTNGYHKNDDICFGSAVQFRSESHSPVPSIPVAAAAALATSKLLSGWMPSLNDPVAAAPTLAV